MNSEITALNKKAEQYSKQIKRLEEEVKKKIVGNENAIRKLIIALIANGHVLLEGVPGLAKTLMIKTLSDAISAEFVRIQFTPDLLPADITGTKIYDHKSFSFKTVKGPVFANFVLADEINRAPPKVQSALLEAMQERQVSIQGETHKLKSPFFVLATENPIESEGTYKLPEAQVDRFMFKVVVSYLSKAEEREIITRYTEAKEINVKKVITKEKIVEMQGFARRVYADDKIKSYVAEIVDATRNPEIYGLNIKEYIEYGASPRASLWLVIAAKANAIMQGRGYVVPEDVKEVLYDVLRHRIILTYEAEAESITSEEIIGKIAEKIKVP